MASRGGHWTKGGFVKGGGASAAVSAFEDGIYSDSIETAGAFSADGTNIFSKDGDRSSVIFTDDEVSLMSGNILTHNHPRGSSFSVDDIELAAVAGMSEMRAVGVNREDGRRYAYSMKPGRGGKWPSQSSIVSAYNRIESETYRTFWNRIDNGSMTLEQASARHHHTIWSGVAPALGLVYSRTRVD